LTIGQFGRYFHIKELQGLLFWQDMLLSHDYLNKEKPYSGAKGNRAFFLEDDKGGILYGK